jgi:AsmA protein
MKRILKIAAIVIAIILVAVIALPFLINVNSFRPRLESELSKALGREVKVGNLGLSLLAGSVSAENLAIADDPAFSKDPFVTAKSLSVGVELLPLILSKQLNVTDLTLDTPEIRLLQAPSGKWNFSSLGGESSKSSSEPSSSNANLSVKKLQVKDGSLVMGRSGSSKTQTYKDVDITVQNFSYTSQFPFTLTGKLPGGGDLKLDGKAGPIAKDVAQTQADAEITVNHLDLAASGFVEPSSGIAGIADFKGKVNSDGHLVRTSGTLSAEKLKLAPKGTPAPRTVEVKYALDHSLEKQAGTITQGDISIGKALAKLTGTYQMQGENTNLNLKLNGDGMSLDELQAMLPALGLVLPSGSKLNGGTLNLAQTITGTAASPVVTGPIRVANTKLAGFNVGSKLSALSQLSGISQNDPDTSIQNLSTDARYSPAGIQTQNINLTIPAIGVLTGSGSIAPGGEMDYKMNVTLSGSASTGLTQLAGLGSKGGSLPFFIRGTTSNPSFVPDVEGILNSKLKGAIPGAGGNQVPTNKQDVINGLGGLFGKKKKQ